MYDHIYTTASLSASNRRASFSCFNPTCLNRSVITQPITPAITIFTSATNGSGSIVKLGVMDKIDAVLFCNMTNEQASLPSFALLSETEAGFRLAGTSFAG